MPSSSFTKAPKSTTRVTVPLHHVAHLVAARRCRSHGSGRVSFRLREMRSFSAIDLEHHHVDLLAFRDDVRGVAHPAPGHLGDVEQSFDPAANVDERAEVGDPPDDRP